MAFNPLAVDQIDQSTVENEGSRYPLIYWLVGDKALKKLGNGAGYMGGFFIAEENAPVDMTAYGWTKESHINGKGEEVEGFWIREITFSLINRRRRWVVTPEGSNKSHGFPWGEYKGASELGRPKGSEQFMILIKGAEDLGVFCLSLRGHAGMAFIGQGEYQQTGVISTYRRTVITAANAMSKQAGINKRWPDRAFWLTVGAARDAKGAPVFKTVGKGEKTTDVVLPMPMGLPNKANEVTKEYLGEIHVDEALPTVNQCHAESLPWVEAWNTVSTSEPTGEGGATEGAEEADVIDNEEMAELGV